jgi:hypothetical protein
MAHMYEQTGETVAGTRARDPPRPALDTHNAPHPASHIQSMRQCPALRVMRRPSPQPSTRAILRHPPQRVEVPHTGREEGGTMNSGREVRSA